MMIATFPLLIIGLTVFTLLGVVFLKLACFFYNLFVGGYQAAELEVNDDIRDESYNVSGPADPNPFAAPRQFAPRTELSPEIGVRSPSIPKAFLIVGLLVLGFVTVGIFLIRASVSIDGVDAGPGAQGMVVSLLLFGLIYFVAYVAMTFLLTGLLPTKFVKSLIVAKLFLVLWLGCVGTFVLGLFALFG